MTAALGSDEFARLDALSRERALTPAESARLELLMTQAEGRKRSWGLTKELARHGMRRDGSPVRREAGE